MVKLAAEDPADYADLTDRALAAVLKAEDAAEETGLNSFDRLACRVHRRWVHQCVSSPEHVSL